MSRFEILCVTMHQKDFSKIQEMNIHSDVVFANQADGTSMEEMEFEGHRARMITTESRGLSRNRNIAIQHMDEKARIVMFTDDDLRFYNDCECLVIDEFERHPEADAIKFNINSVSERKISMKPITEFHMTGRREIGSWGVCGLAIRSEVIKEEKLYFNERFGTGTDNYCGEDTIFLQELLKRKIKLYASPIYIADIDQSVSTWFTGYDERYFLTTGMVLHEMFPHLSPLLAIRSAWRFSKRKNCGLKFWRILHYYYKGIEKNRRERKRCSRNNHYEDGFNKGLSKVASN